MWIIRAVAVLFLGGALWNTVGPHPDPANALVGYGLALFLIVLDRYMRRQQSEIADFCAWVLENKEAIKRGDARLDGLPIDEDTTLVQYQAAMSLVLVMVKVRSRFYLLGYEASPATALQFTVASLLLGWWSLHGAAATIDSVVANARGGKRTRLGDLLDDLTGHEKEVVRLTERAAEQARRIMAERGFPKGPALWIEPTGRSTPPEYQISYDDQPPTDGSCWRSESHGVPVVVRKKDEPRLAGLVVDFLDGDFAFQRGRRLHINPDL